MNEKYFIIMNADKEVMLFGYLFLTHNAASQFAMQHMVGQVSWRIVPVKCYEVL